MNVETPNYTRHGPASTRIEARLAATIEVGPFPSSIAVGAGGVWVSVPAQDASSEDLLVRIDPQSNRVSATIPLKARLEGLVAGEGAVWGTWAVPDPEGSDGDYAFSLVRIDPHANRVAATIPDLRGPVAVGEGAVWATMPGEAGRTSRLVRVDPVSNQIVANHRREYESTTGKHSVCRVPGDAGCRSGVT